MTNIEKLERMLESLPDIYLDFTRCTLPSLVEHGLVDEVIELLNDNDEATTETVLIYEMERRGIIEIAD